MAARAEVVPHGRGSWRGALELEFAPLGASGAAGSRTVIATRRHEGPFCIQRPFYPEGDVCHAYLLHPPGGLAAGDVLELDAEAGPGSTVLLTTPAATKFYRAADGFSDTTSRVRQTIRVGAGASLELLPLESIVFGGSRVAIETHVHLDRAARYVGWEITALGRPLSGDRYAAGSLVQRTRIEVDGAPLLDERLRLAGGERLLAAPWGLAGYGVCGAVHAYPADSGVVERVRAALRDAAAARERATQPPPIAAATLLERLLVVRCLAPSVEPARALFEAVWRAVRPSVIGRAACAPRIWRT